MAKVVESCNVGRYLVANKTYKYGEMILAVEPDVVAFGSEEITRALCSDCCLPGKDMRVCSGCKQVYYCGQGCQKRHWKRCHKVECRYLNTMRPRMPVGALMAVLRALLQVRHNQVIAASLQQMESHSVAQHKENSIANLDILVRGLSAQIEEPDLTLVEGLYHRLVINSMELVSDALEPLGVILDSTIALLNHSCSPNAYVTFNGNRAMLRTFSTIQADEQITISYIDVRIKYKLRQAELRSRYYFNCKCERCLRFPDSPSTWEREIESYKCCDTLVMPERHGNYVCTSCFKTLPLRDIEALESLAKQSLGSGADIEQVTASIRALSEKGWWSPFSQPLFSLHMHATGLYVQRDEMHRALFHALWVIRLPLRKGPIMSNDLVHLVKTMQIAIAASVDSNPQNLILLDKMELAALALYLSGVIEDAVDYTHGQSRFSQVVHSKIAEFRQDLKLDARGASLLSVAAGSAEVYERMMQPIFDRVARSQTEPLAHKWL